MKFNKGDKVKTPYGNSEIIYVDEYEDKMPYKIEVEGKYKFWCEESKLELIEEKKQEENKEQVNHPSHYKQGKYETIEKMRLMFGDEAVKTFCKLNAFKYIDRADYKENKEQDLRKAEWYLNYLEEMEK